MLNYLIHFRGVATQNLLIENDSHLKIYISITIIILYQIVVVLNHQIIGIIATS